MSTTSFATASKILVSHLVRDVVLDSRHALTNPFPDLTQATQQLERLLHSLAKIGLEVEVRQGDESSLLVFVRAYDKSLGTAVYRSR